MDSTQLSALVVSVDRIPSRRKAVRPSSSSLSPILAHALAIAAKRLAADYRDSLAVGAHELAENIRIVGTLEVAYGGKVSGRFAITNLGIVAPALVGS